MTAKSPYPLKLRNGATALCTAANGAGQVRTSPKVERSGGRVRNTTNAMTPPAVHRAHGTGGGGSALAGRDSKRARHRAGQARLSSNVRHSPMVRRLKNA